MDTAVMVVGIIIIAVGMVGGLVGSIRNARRREDVVEVPNPLPREKKKYMTLGYIVIRGNTDQWTALSLKMARDENKGKLKKTLREWWSIQNRRGAITRIEKLMLGVETGESASYNDSLRRYLELKKNNEPLGVYERVDAGLLSLIHI